MAILSERFGLRSGFLFYLALDLGFLAASLVVIRAVRRLRSA
jgi:hypothetical protein